MVFAVRFCLASAGLCGATGVALAAASAHLGEALLGPASLMLLVHATALTACTALLLQTQSHLIALAASLLGAGALVFGGSLALHALAGVRPVPLAAPIGGLLMIAGWLVLACSAVWIAASPRDSDAQIR